MKFKQYWRLFLVAPLCLAACTDSTANRGEKITIGTISYTEGAQVLKKYARFKEHLAEKSRNFVALDPAYNENRALARIRDRSWSLVFAPPGLAALAMQEAQYRPLFPLQGVSNLRSILVVRNDSPVQNVKALNHRAVALGQVGSVTGYYFPLFNLYGLTLSELVFAPTPRTVLEWVASGRVAAGALSKEEFDTYAPQLPGAFRVLAADTHHVPAGVVLISPTIERNRQEQLRKILRETPSVIAQEVGYIPTGALPDYRYLFSVVERVRKIFPDAPTAAQLKPARLEATGG